jgi:hypothetical protein
MCSLSLFLTRYGARLHLFWFISFFSIAFFEGLVDQSGLQMTDVVPVAGMAFIYLLVSIFILLYHSHSPRLSP